MTDGKAQEYTADITKRNKRNSYHSGPAALPAALRSPLTMQRPLFLLLSLSIASLHAVVACASASAPTDLQLGEPNSRQWTRKSAARAASPSDLFLGSRRSRRANLNGRAASGRFLPRPPTVRWFIDFLEPEIDPLFSPCRQGERPARHRVPAESHSNRPVYHQPLYSYLSFKYFYRPLVIVSFSFLLSLLLRCSL